MPQEYCFLPHTLCITILRCKHCICATYFQKKKEATSVSNLQPAALGQLLTYWSPQAGFLESRPSRGLPASPRTREPWASHRWEGASRLSGEAGPHPRLTHCLGAARGCSAVTPPPACALSSYRLGAPRAGSPGPTGRPDRHVSSLRGGPPRSAATRVYELSTGSACEVRPADSRLSVLVTMKTSNPLTHQCRPLCLVGTMLPRTARPSPADLGTL